MDDDGVFTAEAGAFAGLPVLGAGNAAVIEALQEQGALLLEEAYGHKYPYDWRTKKPTIFRATDQVLTVCCNVLCSQLMQCVNKRNAVCSHSCAP